jgi:hypothetical protein
MMIHRLRARDLLRDFERDGLDVYNSPQTNLGAALAALNHLEDSPAVRRLQANIRVAAAQIEERGPGYNRSTAILQEQIGTSSPTMSQLGSPRPSG